MFTATIVCSVLLALIFTASGLPKLRRAARTVQEAEHLGIPPAGYALIGLLELLAAAGLLTGLALAPIGIASTTGLAFLMIGAVGGHLRAGDPLKTIAPALIIGIAATSTLALRIATT